MMLVTKVYIFTQNFNKNLIMKKVILAFSAMFALTIASFAQTAAPTTAQTPAKVKGHGKEMKDHPKKGTDEAKKGTGEKAKGQGMGANLGLSADQQAQYGAINKAHQEAVRKVQMDNTLAPEAKKTQVAALKSKYETDLKGVMNAEQYAKWSEQRAKRAENKAGEKMGDHKGGDHKAEGGERKMGDKKPKAKSDKAQTQGASKSN